VGELDVRNAIVFCNRKRDVVIVHNSLARHGFNAAALHGDMDQHQRMATLEAFRNGEVALLVASDVAARGLDIPDVSHIINFDVPGQPEDYVHRIGRTGRAGRQGVAAMLVTASDFRALKAITNLVRQDIEWIGEEPSQEQRESRGGRRQPSRRGQRRQAAPAKSKSPQKQPRQRKASKANGNGETASREKAPAAAKKNDAPKATGMGDHVPNFMKRPVRTP
jgi:superfamily II DNA/RNA helicase